MSVIRWVVTGVLGAMVRHQGVVIAIVSTVGATLAGLALQEPESWRGVAIMSLSVLAIVLTGAVPSRYGAAQLLQFVQPAIFESLSLREGDRITLHLVKSIRSQQYEQVTEYFPGTDRRSRGRVFSFSYGIVGQCFKTREAKAWGVPVGSTLEAAMQDRWGFTAQERASVTGDRRAFFAYPVGQEGPFAQAVLYIDSARDGAFNDAVYAEMISTLDRVFRPLLAEALRRA